MTEIGPNGLPVVPREASRPAPAVAASAPGRRPRERRPERLGPALSAVALGLAAALLLGPLTGIPAIVLGVVGYRRARPGSSDRTNAVTGIVLGTAGTLWWTFVLITIFT